MKTLIVIISTLVVLATGQALAQEPSPMMVEIKATMEAARQEVADLKLQYQEAAGEDAALEIMHEVARVKRESRIEVMRIQLRHARLAGNDELVAKLEAIITMMTAPPVKGTPVPRPDPQQ